MLVRYVQEFTELQKRQASTTKMLEASVELLQKAGGMIGRQGSRLERERADRDEVQDRLSHLVDQVATHVLRLRDAYRRASETMPAVGLNPLHGHVHVSAQHDRWIKLRRCRSVTVAQSVWVCLVAFSSQYSCFLFVYFCQPTSVDSCTLHALCQTPKSGSRRELLLPSRAPFVHPA